MFQELKNARLEELEKYIQRYKSDLGCFDEVIVAMEAYKSEKITKTFNEKSGLYKMFACGVGGERKIFCYLLEIRDYNLGGYQMRIGESKIYTDTREKKEILRVLKEEKEKMEKWLKETEESKKELETVDVVEVEKKLREAWELCKDSTLWLTILKNSNLKFYL